MSKETDKKVLKLRWKRNESERGLARVGAGPRGSKLHDGEKKYASVEALGRGWSGSQRGWFWVAGWGSGVPYKNTCHEPAPTEAEAKKAAREYVLSHLRATKTREQKD